MKQLPIRLMLAVAIGIGLAATAVPQNRAHAARLARKRIRWPTRMLERAGMKPGRETADLDHLHPDFRKRVERIKQRLQADGHTVRVAATYRSPERQEFIYKASQVSERLGGSPGTQARGGQSCHNQEIGRVPASAAIDLRGARDLDRAGQARFYKALGRAAAVEGLRWGGSWSRKNPVWARYDLGWDPGHIEDAALCRRLRRAR